MNAVRVNDKDFIKIWQTSDTITGVMEKTKITRQAVYVRARALRKIGVPLKAFQGCQRSKNKELIAELVEYAKSFEPK